MSDENPNEKSNEKSNEMAPPLHPEALADSSADRMARQPFFNGSPSLVQPSPPLALVGQADNRFDPLQLRLSQDFTTIGVKKALVTVPVRRPNRQSFVRVRPGPNWRLETAVVELKEEGEVYLVDPSLRDELVLEIVLKVLFVAIDRHGVLFLWPVKLPQGDGRQDEWSRSALIAAEKAMTTWIRVVSNRGLGAYEIYEAKAEFPDPDWPAVDLRTILETAFRDRFVDTSDHPIVRRLRGDR